jgi:hypothetical protein
MAHHVSTHLGQAIPTMEAGHEKEIGRLSANISELMRASARGSPSF